MEKIALKTMILDILSREPGHAMSISELAKKIERSYGTAYYANTYKNVRNLLAHGSITRQRSGRSSLVALNFANYLTVDSLAEMELARKHHLLEMRPGLMMLLADIDERFKDSSFIRSMSLVNPERNMRLNRMELLIILQNLSESRDPRNALLKMHSDARTFQKKHNTRIDALILSKDELLALLQSSDINPVKEMLSNKIAFFHPQTFWTDMQDALERGIQVRTRESETHPARIPKDDLVYNLTRFGYKEIGTKIVQGKDICIEYIVTSILMKNDARRINSIPIILAKNNSNYNLLVFLSQKYGVSNRMLGLLKVLNRIRPSEEVQLAIGILETLQVTEIKADEHAIREKMRLYGVA